MRTRFLGKILLFAMMIYSALRLLFLFLNFQTYSAHPVSSLVISFLHGLRFDLSSILMVNLVLLPFIFFVSKKVLTGRNYQKFLMGFFVVLNFPFLLFNIADFEYYKFTGHRLNLDILFFRKEAAKQVDQFALNYWHLFMIVVVTLAVLVYFFPRVYPSPNHRRHSPLGKAVQIAVYSLVLTFVFLFGIRGGFQPKPLQPIHAYDAGESPELGVLALNSTFTMLKTRRGVSVKPVNYYSSMNEVVEELRPSKSIQWQHKATSKQNVVIIMLESFGAEFWGSVNTGRGFTPFLDNLAQQGILFKNNFANGRRSIDALPALFFGVPSFVQTPIVKTNYYANKWNGLGHIAKRAGIHASFFHGAPKGTMYFDAISAMAGIEHFYPMENFPNKQEFDGHWGIYDEPFLQFMLQKLNEQPEPFVSTVFTISSHQPYKVPEPYRKILPKGRLPIHQSIAYVDQSLEKFFAKAQKEHWYKNTLFIITGDHSQMSESEINDTAVGRHHVPLLMFHPSRSFKELSAERVTQHADILPTLLDYWGIYNEPYLLFGRSILNPQQGGEAIFYAFESFWLVRKDYFLRMFENGTETILYSMDDKEQKYPIVNKEDVRHSMEQRLKSYIQYYNNSLIDNSLYSWFYLPKTGS